MRKDNNLMENSNLLIVTAGAKGADIDVFACAIAYTELMRLLGNNSIAVITGSFTASVTPSILNWKAEYKTEYIPNGSEKYILVDVSSPYHLPKFVSIDNVIEVYDHRHGYQDYWTNRLNSNCHIEMVGSCGTLIWEQYKKHGKAKEISITSAKLLLASIVSNNLAFLSPLTTDQDKSAFKDLSEITGLNEKWITEYFLEQEEILLENFKSYVQADAKIIQTSVGDFVIAQIEMWDATNILDLKQQDLDSVMEQFGSIPWVVNIINISKGYNLIYSKSSKGKEIFEQKFNLKFHNNIAKTNKLMMRKEIMKVLI